MLLVEDNEMNTLLASAILSRTGAAITGTDNGKDALSLLQKNLFDVILMDLHLPIMNGFETTRQIREELKINIPIIAITANIINDEEARCIKAGMNAFITKPYNERELVDTILSCCKNTGQETQSIPDDADAPLYNLSQLQKLTHGNRELIAEMLRAFVNQVPATIQDLKDGLQKKNFEQLYVAAHHIKSNIDILQIAAAATLIRQIELLATQEQDIEELAMLISMLEPALLKVVTQIKNGEIA